MKTQRITPSVLTKLGLVSFAACFGLTASANAATQTLSVKLTSTNSGTKSKPTGIGLKLTTGTLVTDPAAPLMPIRTATITLPKGIDLGYEHFKGCSIANAEARGCSSKYRIGTGKATARVLGVDYDTMGSLDIFQVGKSGLFIRTQFSQPAIIDEYLVGKVSKSGSGYKLSFTVPDALQEPLPGAPAQVLDFSTNFPKKSVKVKGKTKYYISTTSCPKSGYVFKGDFVYRDGSTTSVSTTVKCKK